MNIRLLQYEYRIQVNQQINGIRGRQQAAGSRQPAARGRPARVRGCYCQHHPTYLTSSGGQRRPPLWTKLRVQLTRDLMNTVGYLDRINKPG